MNSKRNVVKAIVAAGLTVALTSGIALASIGTGTVTASTLRLRSEATIQSATLAYAPRSCQVSILAAVSENWYKVTYNGVEGYMSAEWLDVDLSGSDGSSDGSASNEAVEPRQAVVTDGPLNVRAGAGTSYDRVGTLQKGDIVTVTDQSTEGWYGITCGDVSGYVSSAYVSFDLDAVDEDDSAPAQPKQGRVNTSVLNVRSGAGTSYDRVGTIRLGAVVTITDESIAGWYGISSGSLEGYVSAEYITIVDGSASSGSSSVGDAAAALAASLVGKPYVYGAAGPNGFDCSGLMYYIYKQLGYSIARGSSSQYYQSGYFVSTSEMQPGDLVYFFDPRFDSSGGTLPTTHVGIYVGNNQFIHASTTSYQVQYDPLFGGYYGPYVVGVKRIA